MRTVSHSSMQRYLKCSYQWDLHYNRGIRKRTTGRALQMGRLIHKGLEASFRYQWEKDPTGEGTFDKSEQVGELERAIDDACTEYLQTDDFSEEHIEEVEDITGHALGISRRALEHFKPEEWKIETVDQLVENDEGEKVRKAVPAIELPLYVELDHDIRFVGYIDLIATHKPTGYTWMIDHKSKKTLTDVELEETNAQFPLYQAALWLQYKIPVSGTLTFQILSKVPALPKMNKNGTLSKADLVTTWEVYKEHVIELGLRIKDYADMEAKLAGKEFFRMTQHYRTIKQSMKVMQETALLAGVMHSPIVPVVRNLRASWECNMCDYKQFCLAELRDEDTDFLLKTVYKHKDEKSYTPLTLENFNITKNGEKQ